MRSMSFLVNDRSTGGATPAVAVTITENADGSLSFSLNVLGPYTGDLRGFFFDVADESRIGTLAVAPTSAGFTEFRQGNDSIKDLGNGANMQGLLGSDGGYDAGIEIGSAGTLNDDYRSFSFTLTSSAGPLTLEDFSNVDFGLRLTSVGWVGGERDDAVKLLEHTSSAIDARDDANALIEDQGPNQVGGNVFDNDANLGPVHLVVAVNGSAGNVGDEVDGTYGTLRLNLNGTYTYTLDNTRAAVQALGAGQTATEDFTYAAKKFDELTSFSSDSATLSITITGTNDGPVIAGNTAGAVFEDGSRNASGQLLALDPDSGDSFTWSVDNPGTLTNPSYRFLIDNFRVARNGDQFYFNDTFGDGVPPPSGPGIPSEPFPLGAPNYTLNGTFQESGGRVILDGSRSVEVEGLGNPNPRFATSARLLSDNTPNLNRGLKIDDSFTVEGRFDLVLDLDPGDNYGIRLTDSGGGVTGSDLVQVVVRLDAAGNFEVALVELDGPTDTSITRQTIALEPLAGENQIVLRLSHAPGQAGVVQASFDLLGGAAPRSFGFTEVGHIFGTGTPGDTSDDEVFTRAEFRAAADGVMQNGVYGTLSVDANGKWNYELNNAAANVQALAQGEHDTDTFTVRATDEHGAIDTETVTIDVTGTNDVPIITGGTSGGGVAEDTPAQTASGQLFAFDPDHNAALRWSAGPATVLPGSVPNSLQIFGYTADFQFKLDRFTIERNNDGLIFDDTFSDGFAPPSAPNFANGTPANYLGSFGYVEANGELHLDGARSLALRGVGNPALTVGQLALLATNVDPNDLTRGLKSDDSFSVEGTFDLVLPGDGQAYGIGLTDTAFGVLPPDQLGEDNLALLVRRGASGELLVQFNQLDTVADTSTTVAERVFVPLAGQNQITLRLVHDVANLGVVRAEFDLLGAGDPQTFGLPHTGHIFGSGTPGYAGDDENWTRAQIVAFGPDAYGQSTTYQGTYGSLTVQQDGQWTYTLDNGAANVQALPGIQPPGQLLPQDVISVRVVDEYGTSSFRPVFITVAGSDDPVAITGGVFSGVVQEDTIFSASGTIAFTDVDLADLHSASFFASPFNTTVLGTFSLSPVVEAPNAADGSVAWTYTLDNVAAQSLADGQTVTETYTITVRDDFGASFDDQLVTITIRGAQGQNNPPVARPDNNDHDGVIEAGIDFLGLPATGDAIASGNVILGTTALMGQDTDPDGDTLRVSAVSVGGVAAQVGVPFVLTYGSLVINEDGSWTYTLDNADPDTNALRQGPIATPEAHVFEQPVTYTVADGRGGIDSAQLSIHIAGTNDAPILVADTNNVTEGDLPTSVTGNVLANDSDPEGSLLSVFAPGVPTPPGMPPAPPIQGRYGTLTLNQDGSYLYTTNPNLVNFLNAGEVAHDVFKGVYSVSDGMTFSNATSLDIAIHGADEPPSIADAAVFEDGPRKASGEIDLTGAASFTVNGTGPMTPWADYRFRLDNLSIVRNGTQFFNDDFGNGVPPPAATAFSYLTSGTFTESSGRVTMDGAFAVASGPGFAGHSAILDTGTTADTTSGLKRSHDFRVEARFDLVLPDQQFESYGMRLTDAGAPGGGDDVVEVAVRRLADGSLAMVLREGNVAGSTPLTLAEIPLVTLPSDNRIVLRLEHTANTDDVRGSFDLISGDLVTQTGSFGADVGHIFGNETWTRAQFLGFSPSQTQNGAFGTLSLHASGDWTYALRNSSSVQALAQGERATDVFTVQATDANGASTTQTIAVDVIGTNDSPIPAVGFNSFFSAFFGGGINGAYVIEDGAQQSTSGTAFFSDDHGLPVRWSVTANAPGPVAAYRADYLVRIDELKVTKDGALFLQDPFDNGAPPPAAVGTESYITTGLFSEPAGGGRAILDGQRAGAIGGVGNSELLAANVAILDTNIGVDSPGRGLKSHNDFVAEARFDFDQLLVLGADQAFGIALSDRAQGELPTDQLGDDIVNLLVMRDATGGWMVQFDERDQISDSITVIDTEALLFDPAAGQQIVLRLEHDKDGDNFGLVRASFEVTSGSTVLQSWASTPDAQRADRIFGAETPDNPYDNEAWTRLQFIAFGPDTGGTAAQGAFGSVSVQPNGDWTYTLNNAAAQGLNAGQIANDSFNLRATDAYGASVSRQFNVSVVGTGDEQPAIPVNAVGGPAADVLVGSMAADRLTGAGGSDLLIGLAGPDTFDFNNINEGSDTISDFTPGVGGDVLDFSNLLQGYVPGSSNPFSFVSVGTFQSQGVLGTVVSVDPDGEVNGVFNYTQVVTLQGVGGVFLQDLIDDGNLLLF